MSTLLEAAPLEDVAAAAPPQDPFTPLREVLERWFYKPDLQAIRIVLGTIKSHYLNLGDPAWLFAVAPPGSGKTSISIVGASGLPEVQVLGDLSENTFLSGFYGHHQPGLLEKLGNTTSNGNAHTTVGDGILLMKDFTTVLSMRGDRRNAILGQLREIHDGQFRRDSAPGKPKSGKAESLSSLPSRLCWIDTTQSFPLWVKGSSRYAGTDQTRWRLVSGPFASKRWVT
jgi:hypothetical protein